MAYDPREDPRWTYFVSGLKPQQNEMVHVMAGNPITAEFVAELFRLEGMTNVKWRNLLDA